MDTKTIAQSHMTPREISQELDNHIIGQDKAKRAVAIALRNRWRRQQVNEGYHGYTFGYNRPLLSNRVRDILTVIGWLKTDKQITAIKLVGSGAAGPWTMLAAGLAGDAIESLLDDFPL